MMSLREWNKKKKGRPRKSHPPSQASRCLPYPLLHARYRRPQGPPAAPMAGMSFSTSSTSSRASPSSHLSSSPSEFDSIDPILHLLHFLPYGFLHPLCLYLKLPSSLVLPSSMTIFFLILLTYFAIVSRLVYDIIVEPPGIGSTQDHSTDVIYPIVFLPGCINGQYIIEGLSSDFMFMLGAISLILMDLALDCNQARSVRTSFTVVGTSAMFIAYAMKPHQDPQLPLVIPLSFLLTVANLPPIQDPMFRRFISRLSSPAGGSSSFFLTDDFEDVLVNDGRFVIHGIDGFVAPLASSPPSCCPSFR